MAFLVGPNWDSNLTTGNGGEIGEVRSSEYPLVLCEVGQLTIHDHIISLAMGANGGGMKMAQRKAQLILAESLVGQSAKPGIVAEEAMDFGNSETKPSMPPPVGFIRKYMSRSWVFFREVDLGCKFVTLGQRTLVRR